MIKFQYTNGERETSKRPRQDNDCTVIALVNAFQLDYDTAYDLLNMAGRRSNAGFPFYQIALRYKENFTILNLREQKLSRVQDIAEYAIKNGGNYCVTIHKHVFAIIDGIVLDHSLKPMEPLVQVWRVSGSLSLLDSALFS